MILVFKDSAFRHGFDALDVEQALRNPNIVLRSRRGFANVYEVLGRNDAGQFLHIITRRYRRGDDKIVMVFHIGRMADSDRQRFRRLVRE